MGATRCELTNTARARGHGQKWCFSTFRGSPRPSMETARAVAAALLRGGSSREQEANTDQALRYAILVRDLDSRLGAIGRFTPWQSSARSTTRAIPQRCSATDLPWRPWIAYSAWRAAYVETE